MNWTYLRLARAAASGTAVIVVVFLYFAWSHTDQIGLITGDAPSYLMMAKTYAHAGHDRVAAEAITVNRFPPLYPLTLAWTGAADNMPRAHAVTVSFLLLALGVMYVWLRGAKVRAAPALLLVATAAVVPDIWLAALTIQSEYLYLLFSLAAIALLCAFQRNPREHYLYGAAVVMDLAILTRSIGVVMLFPLLVALWHVRWRQRFLALAATTLPLILWYGLHHSRQAYVTDVLNAFDGSPRQVWALIERQLTALHAGLASALSLQTVSLRPLADVFGAVTLLSTLLRCRTLSPDALYLVCYLCLIIIWPYPGDAHRLIWPIVPVLLAQPILAAVQWYGSANAAQMRLIAILSAAPVLAMALPSVKLASERYSDPDAAKMPGATADPVWYGPSRTDAVKFVTTELALERVLARLPEFVPADDCVVSTRPDWINFYAGRRSAKPLAEDASDAAFFAAIKATKCQYIFMSQFVDRTFEKSMYPIDRIAAHLTLVDYNHIPDPTSPEKSIEFILAKYTP